ncbi:patatin-like phospholipase family protein [candidate division KSB1 bacterium]|nr:patatin-like phospholipase family protein [candidate division KSB1 bacterium]
MAGKGNQSYGKIFVLIILITTASRGESGYDTLCRFELQSDDWDQTPLSIVPYQKPPSPRIGLALSGGGLRGISQIGVLQAMKDQGISIDCIVGTSIGSIIGGLYASGYSPEELWDIFNKLDFADILRDRPQRSSLFLGQKEKGRQPVLQIRLDGFVPTLPEAYTPGQKLTELLTDWILRAPYHHEQDFDRLRVPLRIIATDLLRGTKVVIGDGDLVTAMRASIAIPLLISPVEYKNSLLADGGLLDNIPVSETRKLGADLVIAVDSTSPLRDRESLRAPWEIADQVTTIMQVTKKESELQKADFIISLKDVPITSMEVDEDVFRLLYETGYRNTVEVIDELRQAIEPRQESDSLDCVWTFSGYRLEMEIMDSLSTKLSVTTTNRISEDDIQRDLWRLYETGNYCTVCAEIVVDDADTLIIYRAQNHPVLKNVLLQGNTILADSLLLKPFAPLLGRPLNQWSSRSALAELVKMYKLQGFVLASIDSITFNPEKGIASIVINEGRIGRINYSGNQKTKTWVVSRDFSLQKNRVFQLEEAKTGIKNVYATGLFHSVVLKPIHNGSSWEIELELQEKSSTLARLGIAYDLERRARVFAEYSDGNFFGTGNDLTFHALYGGRDVKTWVNLRSDRILKTLLTGEVDLLYSESLHYAYETYRRIGEYRRKSRGARLNLGRQIERLGTISGFVRLENIKLESRSGSGYNTGEMIISTLGFISTVDSRDQIPFPRTGKYHQFIYETSSGKFLGSDLSYFKVQNQLSSFWTFFHRNTLSPQIFWGVSDLTMPFSEQFRIGGMNSFYGLRQDESIGRHVFITRLEYRYFFPWKAFADVYISARFDFGAVWEKSVDIKSNDFISGKGVGIAFATPIGPLALAYGRSSMGIDQFYLQYGYGF